MLRLAATAALCGLAGFLLGGLARPAAIAPQDLSARALAALAEPDHNIRMRALLGVIDSVDASNAEQVAAALESDDIVATECEVKPFVRAAADAEYDVAMPMVQQWQSENLNKWGLEEIARGLVLDGDLAEAREVARTRRAVPRRDAFVGGLVEAWADAGDLDEIAAYIADMPDGGRRNLAIDKLARGLVRRLGLQGAMDWVMALPEDPTPDGVARGSFLLVLRFAMIADPELGRAWYEAHQDLPRARSGRGVVAAEWVEHDPAAATRWLLAQPDDLQSRTALYSGVERWLELDPKAAEAWLELHKDDELAMAGARPLVRHLAYERPLDAIAWTERIPDESKRERALAHAIHVWRESDAAAANQWLAQAKDLPKTTRRILGVEVPQ